MGILGRWSVMKTVQMKGDTKKIYGATFYILEEAYLCRSPLIRSSELALTLISTTDYGLTSVMTVRLACAKDKTSNTAVIIPAKQVV